MPGVIDHARPELLGFAGDDGLCITSHLVGTEAGVKASHDHGNAAFPVFAGNLVGAARRIRLHADRHQVRFLIERNEFHPVIVELHVHVPGREPGDGRGGQRFHLPGTDVLLSRLSSNAGVNDRQAHADEDGGWQMAAGRKLTTRGPEFHSQACWVHGR